MSQEQQPRPGQATLAGYLIIGGSIVILLSAWERVSSLHTLEAQEGFREFLADPPGSGLGLGIDDLSVIVRVLCMVGAGAAVAAAILGFQALKRSASARVALTALAPLIMVGGLAAANLFGPMVVAGIVMLWLQPTRDWYAGRPWVQRYEERRAERLAAMRGPVKAEQAGTTPGAPPAPPAPPAPGAPTAPPASPAPAASPEPHQDGPPPGIVFGRSPAATATAPPAGRPGTPGRRTLRPQALVTACVLTWVSASLVLVGLVITGVMIPSQSAELLEEITRQQPQLAEQAELTESSLLAALYVVLAGLAVWAVIALVLAGLAFAGHNWARITLAVSAGATAGLALFSAVGAVPLLLLVAAAAITLWLLVRPETSRWYDTGR